jgi:signal transduction histidine kinase
MLEAFFDSFFPYFIYFEALSGIEQTQQAKSDFISILSHELRTPLNGILGYAQILMQTIKQKENHECLSYILQSGQRLLKIFENLILFQELRLKNYRLVNDNFSLIDIKRRIEFEFEAKVSEKNNQLQFLIQEDTPLICKGDAFLLLTVLINLVDNANKFTQNGQIHILLNFHMEKNAINFHINDTGCGFPEDKIEQVGKDFQQIETAMTRNYEGLGIGLSLVKEILKIVEGDLIIESKVSSGTKIKVLFPIQECEFHIV